MAMTSVGPVARAAVFSDPDRRPRTTRMSTPPGRASAAMPASAAREPTLRSPPPGSRDFSPRGAARRAPG